MKKFSFSKMICCLLILITSCIPDYAHVFEENNKKFDDNKMLLNNTLLLIERDYVKKWDSKMELTLETQDFRGQLKKNLLKLGIGKVEISGTLGCDIKNYIITLHIAKGWNITTLRVVQLIYSPCDIKGKKRDRDKRFIHINHKDYWGQGGGWFIYSNTDKF